MRTLSRFSLQAVFVAFLAEEATAVDRFVSPAGADTANDCSVSASPCATLPVALGAAGAGDTIRIAGGTYKVNLNLTASVPILLVLQGGWNDAFTVQNVAATPTTLTKSKQDRVLTVHSGSATAGKDLTLSDLILHASKPKGLDMDGERSGGAILAEASGDGVVLLHLTRVVFSENKSTGDGGAMRVATAGSGSVDVFMSDCDVSFSKAKGEGGVMEADSYESSRIGVSISDSVFSDNKSSDSGGVLDMEAWDSSTLSLDVSRSEFRGNSAKSDGGAIKLTGYVQAQVSAVAIANSAFVMNSSKDDGGALAVEANDNTAMIVEVASSTFAGNSAKEDGGGVRFLATSSGAALNGTIVNAILWGNTGQNGTDLHIGGLGASAAISYSDVDDVLGPASFGSGNLSVDPMLAIDRIHLLTGSPMIDAGTCAGTAGLNDLDDEVRPGPNGPNPSGCDIGADEF